jgi:2-polyprenyl-6-methoxyphenol hydroxylase-like FAD-dependent oxidoreductase
VPHQPAEPAVVVGCGIAGMAAAAALRPYFGEVVLLERDRLRPGPAPRRGVPQSEQLHNLLGCAQVHLERLLPGFLDALLAAGGRAALVAEKTHVYELGTRMPERDVGLRLMCAWRPVIEHVARTLLVGGGDGARVTIRQSTHAVGLRLSSSGTIEGVEVEDAGGRSLVPAAVVVDASGGSSRAPRWLSAVGAEAPRTTSAHPDQWYLTTLFEGGGNDSAFWLTFPTPPGTRGGLVSPVGQRRWCVSLSGRSGDLPPTTVDEVRAFARTLEDPAIATLLDGVVGVSEPQLFRKVVATWRRYEQLRFPVPGFLPIGDAIASLNPLFGQGMSVAAWQASELAATLGRLGAGGDGRVELTRQYLDAASAAVGAAWSLGDVVDGSVAATGLRRQAVARLVHEDPAFHALYVRIWHLLEPATALDQPDVRARIDRAAIAVAEVS